jgi:hypothetical protein
MLAVNGCMFGSVLCKINVGIDVFSPQDETSSFKASCFTSKCFVLLVFQSTLVYFTNSNAQGNAMKTKFNIAFLDQNIHFEMECSKRAKRLSNVLLEISKVALKVEYIVMQ